MTTGEDEGGGECEGCGVRPSRHRTQHARLPSEAPPVAALAFEYAEVQPRGRGAQGGASVLPACLSPGPWSHFPTVECRPGRAP